MPQSWHGRRQRTSRLSWYDLPSPSPPTFGCLPPLLPPLCSNSKAYLCNLCNYVVPTLRLTTDQYWTCLDLVPTPRDAIYMPFLHLSYLPDPFSLTITGIYSFFLFNSFLHVPHCKQDKVVLYLNTICNEAWPGWH